MGRVLLAASVLLGVATWSVTGVAHTCVQSVPPGRAGTLALLKCGVCSTAELVVGLPADNASLLCGASRSPTEIEVVEIAVQAVVGTAAMQGQFFLNHPGAVEENATECLRHLIEFMPRRDLMLLFSRPYEFIDFLIENVREAERVWPVARGYGATWQIFLETVLPYAVLDEKRDLGWHGRRRLNHALMGYPGPGKITNTTLPPPLSAAINATAAMHTLVQMLPFLMIDGPQGFAVEPNVVVNGNTVNWRGETAPAMLSPEQVVEYGGASCTGTAVILVAAARAVGIPARIAGCSQSVVVGDDHHWCEFFDDTTPGPFSDFWHTKEGVSIGNEGGPWDSLSIPMQGCMRGVKPRSVVNTLWAASWSSSTYLPLQWSDSITAEDWSFVGGINRCGAYCTAFGCGVNQSSHWDAQECQPTPA